MISSGTIFQYWVALLAGFVVAGLALLVAQDLDAVASTATLPAAGVGVAGALVIELLLTAVFVAVILNVTKSAQYQGSVCAATSLTLVAVHLAAATVSGASVNPGRTLGSAIIGAEFSDGWNYIVGPMAGAALGWVLYRLVTAGEVDNPLD